MRLFKVLAVLIFMGINFMGYSAYLEEYSLGQREVNYQGEQWEGVHYWPERIVVVRSRDEAVSGFSLDLPEGYYVKGWRSSANNGRERYETEMRGDTDIKFGIGSIREDGSTDKLSIESYGTGSTSLVYMLLASTGRTESSAGAIGIRGRRSMRIDRGVPDGVYSYNSTLYFAGRTDIQRVMVEIITLPEISVGDIDFGTHIAGDTLDLSESSEMRVGGAPGREYKLEVEDEVLELANPGSGEIIPVNLSIEGGGRVFNGSGESTARLRAVIDGVKAPERGGVYRGTATVILSYD